MSDQTNLDSGFNKPIINPFGVPVAPALPSQVGSSSLGVSSIGPSSSSEDSAEISSSRPDLVLPSDMAASFFVHSGGAGSVDPDEAAMLYALQYQKICSDILDSWTKSLQEEAARIQAQINSPSYQAMQAAQSPQLNEQLRQRALEGITPTTTTPTAGYSDFLRSIGPTERMAQQRQDMQEAIRTGLVASSSSFIKGVDGSKPSAELPFVTGLMVAFGSTAIQSSNVIAALKAPDFISQMAVAVPAALQPAAIGLGMLSGLFSLGVAYFSVWQNLVNPSGKEGAQASKANVTLGFAETFAKQMLSMVRGGGFEKFVATSFLGLDIPEGEKNSLLAQMKIVLLSSALALVYVVEAGKITAQEFGSVLKGEISFKDTDVRSKLVAHMKDLLNDVDPSHRAQILENVLAYMDNDPKIEELLEPQKVVESLFVAQDVDHKRKGEGRA